MAYTFTIFVPFTLVIFLVGPDICGYSTKKVHVIFNYKGQNHLIKKDIKCKVCFKQTV